MQIYNLLLPDDVAMCRLAPVGRLVDYGTHIKSGAVKTRMRSGRRLIGHPVWLVESYGT